MPRVPAARHQDASELAGVEGALLIALSSSRRAPPKAKNNNITVTFANPAGLLLRST
jgi:hypothetical protein